MLALKKVLKKLKYGQKVRKKLQKLRAKKK
jgi:hypothetical protein